MSDPVQPTASASPEETLVLGGGCFWCLDALFRRVRGVRGVTCGYAGGTVRHPTYAQVCDGATGHAEVVRISFAPEEISRRELLDIFWHLHDPTTPNRQGADVGTQYRSVLFFTTPEEKVLFAASMAAAQKNFPRPICTEIASLETFWPAEEFHQDYFRRNPDQPYCALVIAPKVTAFFAVQQPSAT